MACEIFADDTEIIEESVPDVIYLGPVSGLDDELVEDADDDQLDEYSNNIFVRTGERIINSRIYWPVLFFINALALCFNLYQDHIVYNPEERDLLEDNLFSGNSIVASDEEVRNITEHFEEQFGVTIDEELVDEYCVLNAIRENPNLSDEEKDFFYRYIDLIKDNPYLNKQESYSSLLNVEILYKRRPVSYDESIEGVYSHDLESIGIFVDDDERRVLAHEGIHCIYSNAQTENLPTYFMEGMTELLANEYFAEQPFVELYNYPFEVAAVKMLCEVTSADTVLKAFSLGDMSIIEDEIANISGDEENAGRVLRSLEFVMKNFRGEFETEAIIDNNLFINGIVSTFRDCIEKKYASDEPSTVSYYYNEMLFVCLGNDDSYNSYVSSLFNFGVNHKAYFSSQLKESLEIEDSSMHQIDNDIFEKSKTIKNG